MFCVLYPNFLDCQFLIARLVFSDVYLRYPWSLLHIITITSLFFECTLTDISICSFIFILCFMFLFYNKMKKKDHRVGNYYKLES
jgi:hypothetical protein